ncbi:hypothetical protein CDL15_Pgr015278 [Punica granatum]|uniref:AP2/ERF domain-containing protein n=1 Tax=Punica granatum TaxID=22663 RepID=A0A218VZX8_PUNGR|nr:hypothetical protein CDL15_Pgr015278 [Punica granatum]
MVKLLQPQNPRNRRTTNNNSSNGNSQGNNNAAITTVNNGDIVKGKRKRRSVPRDSPPQRSSIYRGVTRWTGRYEAHLWDKNCWNESQNKKGRQGAYDDEDVAAHAYDLAALKYWGIDTILNFPLLTYQKELKEMEGQSREEHHHNGRWEARIGRVFGNKYLYLGTYATQEEAAIAYDMAAIEYRGLNAVTNFDLSRYIKWLKPDNSASQSQPDPNVDQNLTTAVPNHDGLSHMPVQSKHGDFDDVPLHRSRPASATSALGLLLQSSKFREMMEMTSAADGAAPSRESSAVVSKCSFPEEIQTYFECQESNSLEEGDDIIFGQLNAFTPPLF